MSSNLITPMLDRFKLYKTQLSSEKALEYLVRVDTNTNIITDRYPSLAKVIYNKISNVERNNY